MLSLHLCLIHFIIIAFQVVQFIPDLQLQAIVSSVLVKTSLNSDFESSWFLPNCQKKQDLKCWCFTEFRSSVGNFSHSCQSENIQLRTKVKEQLGKILDWTTFQFQQVRMNLTLENPILDLKCWVGRMLTEFCLHGSWCNLRIRLQDHCNLIQVLKLSPQHLAFFDKYP